MRKKHIQRLALWLLLTLPVMAAGCSSQEPQGAAAGSLQTPGPSADAAGGSATAAPQASAGGSTPGAPQASAGGSTAGAPQASAGSSTAGSPQASAVGSTAGAPQASGGGSAAGTPQASAGGSAAGTPKASAGGSAAGTPQASGGGSTPGPSQAAPEPQRQSAVHLAIIGDAENGTILPPTAVEWKQGDTVLDVLKRETRSRRIQLETRGAGGAAYVEGIANLYEFDRGGKSGWMYRVNGEFPKKSAGGYQLKEGDRVEWLYTLDLGKDLGAPQP
ncbi:hypothetical protein J31TS4_26740 [Paenibacillus sp. J31TS4]|uniref:DUF4430 domain-containing protein n=1 Tax=Paenibacillus sp. J31TS4 TaxID=2807195 RepID=UPI001B13E38F|nr:DUF4430 domain-containing protein [Paenibacillus sp. J31TS4]GIP39394.1 hypothetical protein J31TS4_26740 [Paenibacillus sp. J31TS4]